MIPFFHGSITELLNTIGYVGLFSLVFAESGVFFAALLPGDSLLFTAGILAAKGYFSIVFLIPLFVIAAVTGNSFGYWFGTKYAKRIFDGTLPFLKPAHLKKAHDFYEKHGARSITAARFVPVVRTLVPILAGAADMNYRTFFTYNLFGGILWSVSITLLGYYLGQTIPNVEEYVIPIAMGIIVVTLIPILKELLPEKRKVESMSNER